MLGLKTSITKRFTSVGDASSQLEERAGLKELYKLLILNLLCRDMILNEFPAVWLRKIYTNQDTRSAGIAAQNKCYGTVTGRGE